MGRHPWPIASETSAGVKSPSGPTRISTLAGSGGAVLAQDGFQMARAGLERSNEEQIVLRRLREVALQRLRGRYHREPVLAALFGGLDRSALPFLALARGVAVAVLDDGTLRDERLDFRGPEFGRLLHDKVHVFPFGNGLRQHDAAAERQRFVQAHQPEFNPFLVRADDLRQGFFAPAIEDGDAVRRL